MRIDCPRCHSSDTARRRRRGIFDQVRACFDRWPYCCRNCGTCFHAKQRYPPHYSGQAKQAKERAAQDRRATGPQMAYRSDPVHPVAKIVLQADNHAQMNEILLALNRAVSFYRQPAKQRETVKAV